MLYAPIVQSSLPAFDYTLKEIKIPFKVSDYSELPDKVEIRVYEIVTGQQFYSNADDLSNYSPSDDSIVVVLPEERGWGEDAYYRAQLRFHKDTDKSEWSTVIILKSIIAPITIAYGSHGYNEEGSNNSEITVSPLFHGSYQFKEQKEGGEMKDKYRFSLYSASNDKLIETSGWIKSNTSALQKEDTYRFKYAMKNYYSYYVIYEVITVNEYTPKSQPYYFSINELYYDRITDFTYYIEKNYESGSFDFYIDLLRETAGNYVISRTSEDNNFSNWEDIKFFILYGQKEKGFLIFRDFTIESGKRYKYRIQATNSIDRRSAPLEPKNDTEFSIHLNHIYLAGDGVQLIIKYNPKINSFKKSTLATKLDTLGGKYPVIARNAQAYYAEFPIGGLISLQAEDGNFLTFDNDNNYYFQEDKLFTLNEKSTDLTGANFYAERRYRECVEKFLNDGKCKLFRSPSEGNMIIDLINISLTPNAQLGRMIYEFSATAYELMEYNMENLNTYQIIHKGNYDDTIEDQSLYYVDQFNSIDVINSECDVYSLLFNSLQEIKIGSNYKLALSHISKIEVENQGDNEAIISVNGNKIYIMPNSQYHLEIPITSLSIFKANDIQITYYYTAHPQAIKPLSFAAIATYKKWGQLLGVQKNEDIVNSIIEHETKGINSDQILFNGIINLSIEADEGTRFEINGKTIVIGRSERYDLEEDADAIYSLKLLSGSRPDDIMINYVIVYTEPKEVD